MLTSVFTNGIRSTLLDRRAAPDLAASGSPISPGGTGFARTPEPAAPLLQEQGDHDHHKERRPEQAAGHHVSKLEQEEVQRVRARTGLPAEPLLRVVQPP